MGTSEQVYLSIKAGSEMPWGIRSSPKHQDRAEKLNSAHF